MDTPLTVESIRGFIRRSAEAWGVKAQLKRAADSCAEKGFPPYKYGWMGPGEFPYIVWKAPEWEDHESEEDYFDKVDASEDMVWNVITDAYTGTLVVAHDPQRPVYDEDGITYWFDGDDNETGPEGEWSYPEEAPVAESVGSLARRGLDPSRTLKTQMRRVASLLHKEGINVTSVSGAQFDNEGDVFLYVDIPGLDSEVEEDQELRRMARQWSRDNMDKVRKAAVDAGFPVGIQTHIDYHPGETLTVIWKVPYVPETFHLMVGRHEEGIRSLARRGLEDTVNGRKEINHVRDQIRKAGHTILAVGRLGGSDDPDDPSEQEAYVRVKFKEEGAGTTSVPVLAMKLEGILIDALREVRFASSRIFTDDAFTYMLVLWDCSGREFHDPTEMPPIQHEGVRSLAKKGLDIGNKAEVSRVVDSLKRQGATVLEYGREAPRPDGEQEAMVALKVPFPAGSSRLFYDNFREVWKTTAREMTEQALKDAFVNDAVAFVQPTRWPDHNSDFVRLTWLSPGAAFNSGTGIYLPESVTRLARKGAEHVFQNWQAYQIAKQIKEAGYEVTAYGTGAPGTSGSNNWVNVHIPGVDMDQGVLKRIRQTGKLQNAFIAEMESLMQSLGVSSQVRKCSSGNVLIVAERPAHLPAGTTRHTMPQEESLGGLARRGLDAENKRPILDLVAAIKGAGLPIVTYGREDHCTGFVDVGVPVGKKASDVAEEISGIDYIIRHREVRSSHWLGADTVQLQFDTDGDNFEVDLDPDPTMPMAESARGLARRGLVVNNDDEEVGRVAEALALEGMHIYGYGRKDSRAYIIFDAGLDSFQQAREWAQDEFGNMETLLSYPGRTRFRGTPDIRVRAYGAAGELRVEWSNSGRDFDWPGENDDNELPLPMAESVAG
mgnify:CR=1 FL=1